MHAQTWPEPATRQAWTLASDWAVFACAGLAVALLVWGLIFFALIRWRARDGSRMPPQFRNNYPLEIGWTVVPLLIVGGLFVQTYRAEGSVDRLSGHPDVVVHVNAYRWGWTFNYEGGPSVGGSASSPVLGSAAQPPPELVLPLGERVRIELTSSDVNHAFWVPDFLFKRDAIPGQMTAFDIEPSRLGSYIGHCAEFCGYDHALMNFAVRIVTPDQFARWRAEAGQR